MEQRTYRGKLSAEGLADFLVQRYDPQVNIQAQRLGAGDSVLVQIGYGENPDRVRHAVTVAIAATTDGEPGLVVTMGQRQWITPEEAGHAAFWGLLAILITPWVLFALLWPLSEMISSTTLPDDVWTSITTYTGSFGVETGSASVLNHPHIG